MTVAGVRLACRAEMDRLWARIADADTCADGGAGLLAALAWDLYGRLGQAQAERERLRASVRVLTGQLAHQDPGSAARARPVSLWEHVAAVLAWLDAGCDRTADVVALRLLKVTEESGEAASAYIGMTGRNPRKGISATAADVTGELCDTAIAALIALATIAGDATRAEQLLAAHVAARSARVACLRGVGSPPRPAVLPADEERW